jgi:polysaccharide export outer membrane protein
MRVKRSVQIVRPGLALLAMSGMSACATLPRNGPTGKQITRDATKRNEIGFEIENITPNNIGTLSSTEAPTGALATLSAEGVVDTLGA